MFKSKNQAFLSQARKRIRLNRNNVRSPYRPEESPTPLFALNVVSGAARGTALFFFLRRRARVPFRCRGKPGLYLGVIWGGGGDRCALRRYGYVGSRELGLWCAGITGFLLLVE